MESTITVIVITALVVVGVYIAYNVAKKKRPGGPGGASGRGNKLK